MPPLVLLLSLLCFAVPIAIAVSGDIPNFREAPAFRNGDGCPDPSASPPAVHVAMTLDATYLRGSLAAIHSVLRHASCPESIAFHFVSASPPVRRVARLRLALLSAFPSLVFTIHPFDRFLVLPRISPPARRALEKPLNYARIYLADLLPASLSRVIYLDADVLVVDDINSLWSTTISPHIVAAPEYCHANFTAFFTQTFWSHPTFPSTFFHRTRIPCYFNTGVMVIDLDRWRAGEYTKRLETWMDVQKEARIYELGSLPPFLLEFAGEVAPVEHKWNQHGLGGGNVDGTCRQLHQGPVSLLHWSGKGKPWLRLDAGRPCPLDALWAPYDLLRREGRDDHFSDV